MVMAAITHYRKQFINTFEQSLSVLKHTATKEMVTNGQTAVFLVAGSGGATAVTRGANGDIPYGQTASTQKTATLVEKHAPFEITGFNVFASQGDQNQIMRDGSMSTINREIDQVFIDLLDTTTQSTGTSVTASLDLVTLASAILGQSDVDVEDMENMFAAITPGFRKYLMQSTEYNNGLYVDVKPLVGGLRKVWRWAGINWIVSNHLSGVGTSTEKCYMWHRNSIGYAVNTGEDKIYLGYDDKQDKSWSRATIYHGGVVLQSSGIIKMNHDGSAIVAA